MSEELDKWEEFPDYVRYAFGKVGYDEYPSTNGHSKDL